MTPSIPADKRRFYRHPVSVPIQYHEVHSRSFDASSTVDLSEGGLSFISDRFLAKGLHINLSIPVCDQVFKLDCQVAYCSRLTSPDRYRVGVAFRDSTTAFRAKLAEEILQIQEYRATLARERGKEISEEEAAREWIAKYARHFSYLF